MRQERKSGRDARAALDPDLSAVGDLFDDERGEEVAVAA
jgi:hypothetical protein